MDAQMRERDVHHQKFTRSRSCRRLRSLDCLVFNVVGFRL